MGTGDGFGLFIGNGFVFGIGGLDGGGFGGVGDEAVVEVESLIGSLKGDAFPSISIKLGVECTTDGKPGLLEPDVTLLEGESILNFSN